MHRRNLMQGLAAASVAAAARPQAARAAAPRRLRGFVETADGARLAVRDWGEGPPVVLAHSWALDSQMWGEQVVALNDAGFRCIAFDRRGHGQSSDPGRGYDADTLAADIGAVIEALDLSGVVLVGHSMGCAEAVRHLAQGGQRRVRAAVLLAPTTPYLTRTADNPQGLPPQAFEAFRETLRKDFPRWVEENKRPFFTPETSPQTMDWLAQIMLRCPLPVALACNRAMTATDFRPDLAKICIPTVVVHGDKDVSAPLELTGRRTAGMVRGARLVVLPDAPHGLFVTHAEAVNREILALARG